MIDSSNTNLSIKARVDRDVLVLQLVGTIDIFSGACLREIGRVLDRKKLAAVLLDMTMVSEVDTSGLQYLSQFESRLKRMGGALRLYRLKPEINKRIHSLRMSHQLGRAGSWRGGLDEIRKEADPDRLIPNSRGNEVIGAIYAVLHPPRRPMESEVVRDRSWLRSGPSPGLHISTTAGNRQYYFYSSIAEYNDNELTIFRTEPQVPVDVGQILTADFDSAEGKYRFHTEVSGLGELELADGISVLLIRLHFPAEVSRRQNRYFSRMTTELAADFKDIAPQGSGGSYQGIIKDLSGGGCLISVSGEPPDLTFINVFFKLPDGSAINDIVSHVNFQTRSDIGDSRLRVQFLRLEPADRDRILQYIHLTQSDLADVIV